MAHNYQYLFDAWAASGAKTAPSTALKTQGFVGGMKPPASVFNYQWDKIGKAITELQQNAMAKDEFSDEISTIQNISAVAKSGSYNDLLNKPELKAVAVSGSYNDLIDIPTSFPISMITGVANWLATNHYAKVAAGTYAGTGTGSCELTLSGGVYSSTLSSPRTITLPFSPSLVVLGSGGYTFMIGQGLCYSGVKDSNNFAQTFSVKIMNLSGTSMQVVSKISYTGTSGTSLYYPTDDMFLGNVSGISYKWIAIG